MRIAKGMTYTAKGIFCAIFLFVSLLPSPVYPASSWIVDVDRHGLPELFVGGASAVTSNYAFWGVNRGWTNFPNQFQAVGPYEYSFVGTDKALNFTLTSHVKRPFKQQLVWDFDLNASSATTDMFGGGIVFKLNLARFGYELGDPDLLPDNRGWAWGRSDGKRLEMSFDPPLPSVYFEQNQKSEIRAFFYLGQVPEGHRHFEATLKISGDMSIRPTMQERFGLNNAGTWPTNILDWQTSPVDLSFLNVPEKPAGKHGFLRAVNGKLIFQDGTHMRFWGTNVTAYALLRTRPEDVKLQARRLSELGFNLVRIHQFDSPWVNPNIFGDHKSLDTKTLDRAMLAKLDWWIKCLEDEGIYVWLDLEDYRKLKAGDGIDDFDEIRKGKPTADLMGYNYVNTSIENAMKSFNEDFLNHRDGFNELPYKDDPGIIALLLTNENDVTSHFAYALMPNAHVPEQDAIYLKEAAAFAIEFGLPKDKTWQAWQPGPSKLFLNDLEHRFDIRMMQQLHEIGVKAPIVTTSSWGRDPVSALPALTSGNIIDVHSYGAIDELEKNPFEAPTFLDWMAAAHVADRPLTVSEWNVSPFPTPDRNTTPLYVAGSASLQGFDALMQYAYSQGPLDESYVSKWSIPNNWEGFNDPALMSMMPAAALLYRRGDVQEAKTAYVFAPTPEQLFGQPISPTTSVALRTAVEKGKLLVAMPETKELPWLEPSKIPPGARLITDPNQSLIDPDANFAISDTGELRRDWNQGTYTIDTARTQAAMGWIGGRQINLADVNIAVTTGNATVAVQSLDQQNISESRRILISLSATSVPESGGRLPYHSEPVIGHITVRAPGGLRLYKQAAPASAPQTLSAPYENGRYQISLDKNLGTYWLMLK